MHSFFKKPGAPFVLILHFPCRYINPPLTGHASLGDQLMFSEPTGNLARSVSPLPAPAPPACSVQAPETTNAEARSVRIAIQGMHCAACTGAVERALAGEAGVVMATVSLLQHSAQVTYNPAVTSPAALAVAIEDCGFTAQPDAPNAATSGLQTVSVDITGMHCAACSTAIETALGKLQGVSAAEVNLLTHSAQVTYSAEATGPRNIVAEIEDCGFDASLAVDPSAGASAFAANNKAVNDASSALFVSLLFSIPLIFIGKIGLLSPTLGAPLQAHLLGFPVGALLQWILATPVQFVVGWRFHTGAVASLRRRSANMDVLVSMGTFASYLYAAASLLHSHFSMWELPRALSSHLFLSPCHACVPANPVCASMREFRTMHLKDSSRQSQNLGSHLPDSVS